MSRNIKEYLEEVKTNKINVPKMTSQEKERVKLINNILQVAKANNVYTDGDLFFSLAFRTMKELKDIAKELHIKV